MHKNIEVINVNKPLLKWASDSMRQTDQKHSGAEELIRGLNGIVNDEYTSLMIEYGDSRNNNNENGKICCGDLSIYISSRRVTRGGTDIILTPKEFDILYFLARNRGEVFTKEQIYQAVWDEEYLLDDSNIMAFIRKIRKKIEPNPDAPQYILTIWGIGYKFNDRL